ncbi:MAG: alpha/beta fold hydrolase [Alphaproteobacteria bacterium]
MSGTKAQALADWAQQTGRAFVRFDYFGHGESTGDFVDGTISRWRDDSLAVIDELTSGQLILVGSSMGGWLSCLATLVRPDRVKALLLIAPAADFTSKLMAPEMTEADKADLESTGVWMRPSAYGEAYPITKALLDDGAKWSILPGPIPLNIPLWILQGGRDPDVPWRHALALSEAVVSEDAVFTLIRDGDHRLSRPQDIARMIATIEELS